MTYEIKTEKFGTVRVFTMHDKARDTVRVQISWSEYPNTPDPKRVATALPREVFEAIIVSALLKAALP